VPRVITVPTVRVHEQVHEREGQQRKPDECTENMGAVFHPKIHTGNCKEADQDQPSPGGQKTPSGGRLAAQVIVK